MNGWSGADPWRFPPDTRAVVTGGTGGLGRSLIPRLAARGYRIAASYLIPEEAKDLEKSMGLAEDQLMLRRVDATSAEAMGEFMDEVVEVYGGMNVEHAFSDRAIAETEGQVVLFHDEPAETFYGATCGGHTENVEVVFPRKSHEYLRGVPCLEAGTAALGRPVDFRRVRGRGATQTRHHRGIRSGRGQS